MAAPADAGCREADASARSVERADGATVPRISSNARTYPSTLIAQSPFLHSVLRVPALAAGGPEWPFWARSQGKIHPALHGWALAGRCVGEESRPAGGSLRTTKSRLP